jgi:DNA-binding NarL/FixJ family response regulator
MLTVNTIIADKQSLFCEGLKNILAGYTNYHINVAYEVSNSDEILTIIESNKIDLIIMDLDLYGTDGIDMIPLLKKNAKGVKLVVLTNYNEIKLVKESMKSGADAYLLKAHDKENFYEALDSIFTEKTYLGPDVHITPPSGFKINSKAKTKFEDRFLIKRKLTKREHEVLGLITQAKNNKEIASELYISDQTVGVHRKNIMKKLGVRNSMNLIKFAFENQLV